MQSYRLVTIATLVDRMKINGSLARQCIADLEEKGIIKPVVTHSKMKIYSMTASAPTMGVGKLTARSPCRRRQLSCRGRATWVWTFGVGVAVMTNRHWIGERFAADNAWLGHISCSV